MKKQYIAALACLLAGAIGFAGVYSSNHAKEQEAKEPALESSSIQKYQNADEIKENEISNADLDEAASKVGSNKTIEKIGKEALNKSSEQKPDDSIADEEISKETSVEVKPQVESGKEESTKTVLSNELSFSEESKISWPVQGDVLLPYSVEQTIYFPTLKQYQYSYGLAISANVNDKVYCGAKGKIVDIATNEETGCTVTLDLGNGYSAIYGQLKELNFDKGETLECGQVIGYVSDPTKYYSVEGSNVYFAMTKDGVHIDPMSYLSAD